jgi:hypothetical protein
VRRRGRRHWRSQRSGPSRRRRKSSSGIGTTSCRKWKEEQKIQIRFHGRRAGGHPVSPRASVDAASEHGAENVQLEKVRFSESKPKFILKQELNQKIHNSCLNYKNFQQTLLIKVILIRIRFGLGKYHHNWDHYNSFFKNQYFLKDK